MAGAGGSWGLEAGGKVQLEGGGFTEDRAKYQHSEKVKRGREYLLNV